MLSEGFEIETEMSVHALELRMPVGEVATAYGARPEGSESKLSTYRDGWRILKTIGTLYRVERPVLFYGTIGGLLVIAAIIVTFGSGLLQLGKNELEIGPMRIGWAVLAAVAVLGTPIHCSRRADGAVCSITATESAPQLVASSIPDAVHTGKGLL